ncbi:MAG: ATP-binding protein, partial [Planctomycetota bacterium]
MTASATPAARSTTSTPQTRRSLRVVLARAFFAVTATGICLTGALWIAMHVHSTEAGLERLQASQLSAERRLVQTDVENALQEIRRLQSAQLAHIDEDMRSQLRLVASVAATLGQGDRQPEHCRAQTCDWIADNPTIYGPWRVLVLDRAGEHAVWLPDPAPSLRPVIAAICTACAGASGPAIHAPQVSCSEVIAGREHMVRALPIAGGEHIVALVATGPVLRHRLEQVVLDQLARWRVSRADYLFAGTYDGVSLVGPARGTNVFAHGPEPAARVMRTLIERAHAGGGFVRYRMPGLDNQREAIKSSYVLPVPEWGWYIGAGVYTDRIDAAIADQRERLAGDVGRHILSIVLVLAALCMVAWLTAAHLSRSVSGQFHRFHDFFAQAAAGHAGIEPTDLPHREFADLAIEANRMVQARERAQHDLQRSEQRFRQLVEHFPLPVLVADTDARIRYVNPCFVSTFGYSQSDLPHLDAWDTLAGPAPEAGREIWWIRDPRHPPAAVDQQPLEIHLRTATGRILVVESSATLIDDHLVLLLRDVTTLRRTEEQLRQSQKMESIGQLAGGIAHDFNNQLTAVMGYADLLAEQTAGPQRQYVTGIARAAEHAADLTGKLLAFARRGRYRAIPVDINATLGEVATILSHTIRPNIELVRAFSSERPVVTGDPTQIENALLNLALNARDAMPDGGTLSLHTTVVQLDADADLLFPVETGYYVRIDVADTGSGIAADTLPHIFEPFFSTKAQGQGTGMGLAAVYGTVEHHAGGLRVDTEPGSGTRISVYLPLDLPDPRPEATPVINAEIVKDLNIAVVDDEPGVRECTSMLLSILGCQTETFPDGATFLDAVRRAPGSWDLVILDLVMPGMDGHETRRALAALAPTIRVILASGFSHEEELASTETDKALVFLPKPFTREQLLTAIAR